MQPLAAYATQTQAEVARALLEDEGIPARVADWSAMRELADYRVFVAPEDAAEAAAILGVDAPVAPGPLEPWLARTMIVVAVLMVLFIAWGLAT